MAILVRIEAGLGNQLFQYAAGKSLAQRVGAELLLDVSSYETDRLRSYQLANLNISARLAGRFRCRWENQMRRKTFAPVRWPLRLAGSRLVFRHVPDLQQGFDGRLAKMDGNIFLTGYWQSERYFADIREVLLKEFTFKDEPDAVNRQMLARIAAAKAVCVHVRRGDFVTTDIGRRRHGVCGMDYYQTAFRWLQGRFSGLEFFIFSDDPQWVAAHFPHDESTTIVAHNAGRNDAEDLRLMMHCRHFIVANSTFSWWAAWLGRAAEKIIIAPQRWYVSDELSEQDLVPESWIRL
jgi:Glycosyl transferase family 11